MASTSTIAIAICSLAMLCLGVFAIVSGTIDYVEDDNTQRDVPCYDKHNNVIDGLTCTEETDNISEIFVGFFAIFCAAIFGIGAHSMYKIDKLNSIYRTRGQNG